ncbi:hypothetical protein HNR65_003627 [Desulfosalsimonas propionicica]|uniref:DUF2157 domain-containing protein n=1 Tax=Desulfosalsimonas propionicica TaxID=332175 RepID=A0A7W0HME1_9BACT|nr:DUF2157 domain-containing protein [Desulfosalsimonas propionicica]MBA2883265.1 hypothetical protein [Desulfosalsimonas propionicica]
MYVSKKEGRILRDAIQNWRETELISEAESRKLKNSYEVTSFDWNRVAKYSFWMAICCIVISISSAIADQWLIALFKKLFRAPDSVKSIGFALFSGGLYLLGIRRRRQHPDNVYSNEAILFLGAAATAAAIAFLGKAMDTGSGHFSLLLLLAAFIYGFLGLWFPSKLVWLFSLLSLGSWFGAETGYASGWGAYYLGMNYPLRFVLFGLVLIFCGSYLFHRWKDKSEFLRITRAVGLLYLFVALWIMSIFGNYSDSEIWYRAKQIELFHWSILFAAASIGAIYHGVKYDDGMTRGFGLTFIFINLYTRFFEYFWEGTHKAIFFALLALSFWFLGAKAEKIWQLSLVKKLTTPSD